MDEKIIIGAKTNENVDCSNCQKQIPFNQSTCFVGKEGQDVYFCDECKKTIDMAFTRETENPNILGAIVLGILAGIIGGFIWYMIEVATGRIIGYVALGVGYLVGWGVILGSGKKRGAGLQLISAVLALISIIGASYFSALTMINKYIGTEAIQANQPLPDYIWISPFDSSLIEMIISPIGLFIWGLGVYIAFSVPKARNL